MARQRRHFVPDGYYHVINRGNRRVIVFHDGEDYARFMLLLSLACERLEMRVLAYVLMPNHFHLLVQPRRAKDLPDMMHWLSTTYAHYHHARHLTTGHLWQGRYRSFAIGSDEYLWHAAAYIERNAVRASLVPSATEWPWGSGRLLHEDERPHWMLPPLASPERWLAELERTDDPAILAMLRERVRSSRPFGSPEWTRALRMRLRQPAIPASPGRPRTRTHPRTRRA